LPFQSKLWPAITRQKIELEFKPRNDKWRCVVRNKKKLGGFWANGIMTGACFLLNYMMSSSDPMRQFFARNIVGF